MKLRNEASYIAPIKTPPCFLLELEITVSPNLRFNTFATGPSEQLALRRWKRGARNIAPLLTRMTVITPDRTATLKKPVSSKTGDARLPKYLR